MAATAEVTRCKYCWRPSNIDGHNEGCPILIGTQEAMAKWERGHTHGFNWDFEEYGHIETWRYRYYSRTFILGYRVGEAEIEGLVDEAYQRRYFE